MSAFQLPEQHRLPFVASDSSLLQAGEHYFFTFLPLLHRLYVTFHAEFIENNTYKLFWVHSSCPRTYGLAFVKGSRCCSMQVSTTFSLFDYFFGFYMLLFMLILLKIVRRTYWECISVPRRPSVAIWQAPFWPLVSFSTSTTPISSMAASAGELPSFLNNFANENHPILFRRKFLFSERTRMLSWASLSWADLFVERKLIIRPVNGSFRSDACEVRFLSIYKFGIFSPISWSKKQNAIPFYRRNFDSSDSVFFFLQRNGIRHLRGRLRGWEVKKRYGISGALEREKEKQQRRQ